MTASPDGRWLLFATSQDMFSQATLKLLDLPQQSAYTPQADTVAQERIANRQGPQIHTSCWSADGSTVFISGKDIQGEEIPIITGNQQHNEDSISVCLLAKSSLHNKIPNWFAIDTDQPELLYTDEHANCKAKPPPSWRFGSNLDLTPARWFENNPELQRMRERATRGLQLVQHSDQALSLQTSDGRVLASHQTTSFWSDHISVSSYAWSGDGNRVAYVINEMAGSMIGPDNRGYVLDIAGSAEPYWIATDIEAIYWHGDNTLFACLQAGEDDFTTIARWQL